MAKDYINVNRSNPQAQLLLQYVQQLRAAYDTGKRVKAVMDHNFENNDFADLEALFGLPAGKGQAVYDLMNGSIGSMEGTFQTSDAKTITEKVG
jgi:hypothetical protein